MMKRKHFEEFQKETEKYKDAVWAFMLEHCDITPNGSLFFKFHATDRKNFENRVWSRYMYEYHREDWEAKQRYQLNVKKKVTTEKQTAKEKYLADKKKRREMHQWLSWYNKTQHGSFLKRLWGNIAKHTWKRKPYN